jgi:hypothetical protein
VRSRLADKLLILIAASVLPCAITMLSSSQQAPPPRRVPVQRKREAEVETVGEAIRSQTNRPHDFRMEPSISGGLRPTSMAIGISLTSRTWQTRCRIDRVGMAGLVQREDVALVVGRAEARYLSRGFLSFHGPRRFTTTTPRTNPSTTRRVLPASRRSPTLRDALSDGDPAAAGVKTDLPGL